MDLHRGRVSSAEPVSTQPLEPVEVGLEDRAQDRAPGRAAPELREERRDQRLLPADDRGRAVRAGLERDHAAAGEQALVADREPGRRLELGRPRPGRVTAIAEDPDGGLAAGPDADRARGLDRTRFISCIHSGWQRDVRDDAPRRARSGRRRPRASAAARRARRRGGRRASGRRRRAAPPATTRAASEDEPARRTARQRIRGWTRCDAGRRAARRAPRSPSPGCRLTAAIASVSTVVRKPRRDRVERGRLDAVVGREAATTTSSTPAAAEQRARARRDRLAGRRVAHRERRSSRPRRCCPCARSACPRRPRGRGGARRPTCPRRSGRARCRRPSAKCGVCAGCQSWVSTTSAPLSRARADLAVDHRDHVRAAGAR